MPKERKGKTKHEHPVKLGDQFLCPRCKVPLPVKQDCPSCKQEIDWSKV